MPDEDECCAICLEGLLFEESTRRCDTCRNRVHSVCLERWVPQSCPFCRSDLRAKVSPCEVLVVALLVSFFIYAVSRGNAPL